MSNLPICPETGEDVDDCDCALIPMRCPNCDERGSACACLDYDESDEADLRRKCEQEERE
jgi:hypothetical protein